MDQEHVSDETVIPPERNSEDIKPDGATHEQVGEVSASVTPQNSSSSHSDVKTDYGCLKKVFVAAGRNMYKTFPSLAAVQRCAQLNLSSQRLADGNRGKRTTGKPHQNKSMGYGYNAMPRMQAPWYAMNPYQQMEQARQLAMQYNPSFPPQYSRNFFMPSNQRNAPQYMQPMLPARQTGDRGRGHPNPKIFEYTQQQQRYQRPPRDTQQYADNSLPTAPAIHCSQLEQASFQAQTPQSYSPSQTAVSPLASSSCGGLPTSPLPAPVFPQFCSAVPAPSLDAVPLPSDLIGSVGSRDSQQLLQQHAQSYFQNYTQQYAQVYAQQYAQQYVQMLLQQPTASPTPMTPPRDPRIYANTPTGPQLQSPKAFGVTPGIVPATQNAPLADVAAQIAQRPQGTTFHFAIAGSAD